MKIIIQSVHFKASPALRKLAREKVGRLSKIFNRIILAEVTLSVTANHSQQKKQACDIRLSIPGKDLFVTKESAIFEESISSAVESMDKRLRRWKQTLVKKKRAKAEE